MIYEYNEHYFKLKSLRDYNYLPEEYLNQFKWNIVNNLYNYLQINDKLQLYNELTSLTTKQQNQIIIKSIVFPKPYKSVYIEQH